MRQGDQRDRDFMAIALDMARLGLGRTSPNPMVGALIVKSGKILSTGFHRKAGRPHAEVEALRGKFWKDATMYVTLEPCCHYGRTPPCTDAIFKSGIREVVIGMRDPDPKVSGGGIRILKKAGIKVRVGVLQKECRELNQAYITHRIKKRPFVFLKMATSLDGKVGLPHRRVQITGPEAMAQSHALRDQVDAILVGSGTILADNPRLTTRLKGQKGKDPVRIVLDGRRRIPFSARVFKVRSPSPAWKASSLVKKTQGGRVDLSVLLRELARRGILSLLVEGGPQVWKSFLKDGLADHLILFLSCKTLGNKGVPALEKAMARRISLKNALCRLVGDDLMVEGCPTL